jgi:hypothetical protein
VVRDGFKFKLFIGTSLIPSSSSARSLQLLPFKTIVYDARAIDEQRKTFVIFANNKKARPSHGMDTNLRFILRIHADMIATLSPHVINGMRAKGCACLCVCIVIFDYK